MPFPPCIAGSPDSALAELLAATDFSQKILVNADPLPDSAAIIARTRIFAADAGLDCLIITLLPIAPPGLHDFALHQSIATLWAFTRQAALEWAPQRIRVNAIGLGIAPFGPDEPSEQAGRSAATVMATPASLADIAGTIRAMAGFSSMTGQIIRLGV